MSVFFLTHAQNIIFLKSAALEQVPPSVKCCIQNWGVNVEERTKTEEININNSDLSEDTDNKDEPRNESRVALKKL